MQGSSCCWGVLYLEMLFRHTWSFTYSHFRGYFQRTSTIICYQSSLHPCSASWSSSVVSKENFSVQKVSLRLKWRFEVGGGSLNCPCYQLKQLYQYELPTAVLFLPVLQSALLSWFCVSTKIHPCIFPKGVSFLSPHCRKITPST